MTTHVDTIHLIHHSHTDIGYTHDQPIVWDLHRRFIDTALEQCERDGDADTDHAFRWAVESTATLVLWAESAPSHRVDRFIELARAGRIEVTGMYANITPLFDADQVIESLAPVRWVREELGLPVRNAMNSDVNGQNWPLVDVLLDAGISGFSMATNIHFGGSPLAWPNAFRWQGPSGRSILAWNGWDYGFSRHIGVGRPFEQLRDDWWPRIHAWLEQQNYPLPAMMFQIFDWFGDNGPACPDLADFVARWNATVGAPRLRISLPADWWASVEPHADALPDHRGDWTDYWNFGCGSSAREVAINRASRNRLRAADAAQAALEALGGEPDPTRRSTPGTRERAGHALNLFDEHTWGADTTIWEPDSEETAAQWNHKAAFAWTARSLSSMLVRDAVAELARRVERTEDDVAFVFNPSPVTQTFTGPVAQSMTGVVRGRAADPTATRHWMDRTAALAPTDDGALFALRKPLELPACGYAIVSRSDLTQPTRQVSDDTEIVTPHHHLVFDRERGGIARWHSVALDREMVDADAGWPLGGWVREAPIVEEWHKANPRSAMWAWGERHLSLERGWQPGWAAERIGPTGVTSHVCERMDHGTLVRQHIALPTGEEAVQETWLPDHAPWIDITTRWRMGLETLPEATYLAFPFAIPDATARLDLGGQAMRVDADQLPRSCRDFHTVQQWADLSGAEFGVTVACPDAPMVQFGDFTFGANLETVDLARAMLLGWVTNNYWETNFRAHQPGMVQARYRLLAHAGPFDEAAAHRFGTEAATSAIVHHLGEAVATSTPLPPNGALLQLPDAPVLTLHILPGENAMQIRLLNASDEPVIASIGSGALRISAATRCDTLGTPLEPIAVDDDGGVALELTPRAFASVRLAVTRPGA